MDGGKQLVSILHPPIGLQPSPTDTPAFLFKLWKVLEAEEYAQFISWSKNGNSFIIYDQNQFSQVVLPNFFKHSHFTSFVRQLNMYGFRKLTNMTYTSNTPGQESMEFHHPHFIKGHPSMLEYVKRKSPSSLRIGNRTIKTADLEKLITDFEHIKFEHEKVLREMNDLKTENNGLRSEVAQLKNKYSRHEQVLTRMMNFIILNAIYPERTPSLLPGIKRRRKILELNNTSNTVAIPEGINPPLSLHPPYDDISQTARSLLQPIDSANIPYHPYFNVDNSLPTQDAAHNSLTLYNANYQGGMHNDDYSLALAPDLGQVKLQQQKQPHIRDDIRKAILAKTGANNNEVVHQNSEDISYPSFQNQNERYPNEYATTDFDQYMPQDDDNIVEFPDDIAFDSSILSEFLLPNPGTLDAPLLQNFNNLSATSDLFNSSLNLETDSQTFGIMHRPEESKEDTPAPLYPPANERPLI
ncbi:Heat shock factor protein 1-like isoform X2 [Oopsacas minuta]|uniref:Heat shock factor protein 1-like isoform X2 n=1 Tax=Oopsacas minuta TaxID=111878 RepID=A0AAV7KKK2_9METZ|nr:Heat shock factor protein 1-like isoform X2 [Oopsacas minuta]